MPVPTTLPLGSPNDFARCPTGGLACPTSPRSADTIIANESYEWSVHQSVRQNLSTDRFSISPEEDLYSCGGCATLG